MGYIKFCSKTIAAGAALILSNSAYSFGFSFQVDTQYANIVPVDDVCIQRVNQQEALNGLQVFVDTMLANCAVQESAPFACQKENLMRHCIQEAHARTYISYQSCRTTADVVVTTTWSFEGMFISTSGESTQTFVGVPIVPEEQQQLILEAKEAMVDICFAIEPEPVNEEVEVVEDDVIEEDVVEDDVDAIDDNLEVLEDDNNEDELEEIDEADDIEEDLIQEDEALIEEDVALPVPEA